MPAAAVVPAIIGGLGAAGSIGGALIGSSAASSAARAQQQAALEAGQKVVDAAAQVNPQILTTAEYQGNNVLGATGAAADAITAAAGKANAYLDPYATTGASAANILGAGIAPGGDFNKTPTLADLQMDPSLAFRLAEGTKALQASAAARGGAISGAALKDLTNYSQNTASEAYQQAFQNYWTSVQNRFNNVNTIAGRGFTAANQAGQNAITGESMAGNLRVGGQQFAANAAINAADLAASNTINAAGAYGNYLTQGANARASGIVGGANAWQQGIGGAMNNITTGLILGKILGNPGTGSRSPVNPGTIFAGNPATGES
jgi:hypothetical protein